jgi:hypothetical protein
MKRKYCLFIDKVDGKEVFLYVDCYGTEWMANFNRFGFRVLRSSTESERTMGGER